MTDIVTAIGLMLVLEGACYALFPDGMKKMVAAVLSLPPQQIRMAGFIAAISGFVLVMAAR
jgi:uncharacterized protein